MKRICHGSIMLALLGMVFTPMVSAMETTSADRLVLLARAWGLAKYRHPDVTACRTDWDQVLLEALEAVERATSDAEVDAAIARLLDDAGTTPPGGAGEHPGWIDDAPVSEATRERLQKLAQTRPQAQCYVTQAPGTSQATFQTDTAFNGAATSDRAIRLLGAFRFWNAIEYFFPYKDDIGRDWGEVLAEHLPEIANAEGAVAYARAMRIFTARIEDGHGFFSNPAMALAEGLRYAPFELRPVVGQPIVTRTYPGAGNIGPGDELIAVDGITLPEALAAKREITFGSNPVDKETNLLRFAAQGNATSATYRFRRPDGLEYERTVPMSPFQHDSTAGRTLRRDVRPTGACDMTIIDLGLLQRADVGGLMPQIADQDAVVFDLRNYPNSTLWPIVEYLYDSPRAPALFDVPDLSNPGSFLLGASPFGASTPLASRPRLLVLMDERSQSQSEYTIMALQATGTALTFGSQTSAADGDLTGLSLPGNIRTFFTGMGVYYPDGRRTQRIGIVPDVAVSPTPEGLAAGRDEVLSAALDCRWLTETPQRRRPETGVYWNPERDGEGLDVHYFGDGLVLLQYAFDEGGQPIWALGVADTPEGTRWDVPVSAFAAQRIEQPIDVEGVAIGSINLDVHRGAYRPICAITDQQQIVERAHLTWTLEGREGESCQAPLVNSALNPLTGLYNARDDAGWGISMHQDGDFIFAVVYGYGPDGDNRWLVGSTPASSTTQALEFDLLYVTGFCRSCEPQPTTRTPAGTLRIVLPETSGVDAPIRIDIEAAFEPGAIPWTRTQLDMYRTVAPG